MSSAGGPKGVVDGPKGISETITPLRSGNGTIDTSTEKDDAGKQELSPHVHISTQVQTGVDNNVAQSKERHLPGHHFPSRKECLFRFSAFW